VPVNLVFNPILWRIALAEQKANDLKAAFGRMLNPPLWEKLHGLAEVVFVL
jgi:hypothetical protein